MRNLQSHDGVPQNDGHCPSLAFSQLHTWQNVRQAPANPLRAEPPPSLVT